VQNGALLLRIKGGRGAAWMTGEGTAARCS
jgi:hypothetical protein